MKRLVLLGCLLFAGIGFAQTTIYQENFETGNSFTLNTADLGGASTYNTWLVNNTFTGGSGTFTCMSFPFTFTVPNTPSQPGGITGAPSSTYMHISAQAAVSSGITCASYIPADATCVMAESNFTRMTTPISTTGYSNVAMDFWWMCAGSTAAFGELYYSLDGGITWTLKQSNFNNVTNWTQTSISDPLWDNQASLLFAFRFVNNTTTAGADPSFSLDEILVTGTTGVSNAISTTDVQPISEWCFGDVTTLQVSFDATGSYNAGNVFTAELSDASGSFAAPTAVGTLTSSASGTQVITAIIPGTTPVGNGYRIRVVASDPATVGSDNGSDLTIHALPTVTQSPFTDVCSNGSPVSLIGGSPAGGSYSGTGVSSGNFDPSVAGAGSTSITYTFTDLNGCQNSVSEDILVNQAPTVVFNAIPDLCDYSSDYTMVATPNGGVFTGPSVTGDVFSPSGAGIGTHTITYDYSDGNGCSDQAVQTVVVDACAGIEEEAMIFSIYPNPANSSFSIVSDVEFESAQLRDINGRFIQEITPSEVVDVSSLSAGVYLVELMHDGERYTERVVVR